MMKHVIARAVAFVVAVLFSFQVIAQEKAQRSLNDISIFYLSKMREGKTREAYLDEVMLVIRDYSADGQNLTLDDVERHENKSQQEWTDAEVAQFNKQDTDGNGQLSRDEVEATIAKLYGGKPDKGQRRLIFDLRVSRRMDRDLNGDGFISLDEIKIPQKPRGLMLNYPENNMMLSYPTSLLSSQSMTFSQLRQIGEDVYKSVDTNSDGMLSQEEMKLVHSAAEAQGEKMIINRAAAGGCTLPAPAADSQVILLPTMQGAMSSAGLFDETLDGYASEVVISPDAPKTYLILTSHIHPFIWRITGAVDRLERVVVLAGEVKYAIKRLAAVTGIPADRVTFVSVENCSSDLLQQQLKNGGIPLTEGILSAVLKRKVTLPGIGGKLFRARISAKGVEMDKLTAAEIGDAPAGYDKGIWRDMVQGLRQVMIQFTPEEIAAGVAELPLFPYATPPAGYGLAKLVHDGVLQEKPNGKKYKLYQYTSGATEARPESSPQRALPDAVVVKELSVEGRDFRVIKPLSYFPTHIYDLSPTYILDKGIQRPEGAVSACVISSDTGLPLEAFRCPKESGNRSMPP
ncbi:MAG: hypothetical protein JNM12_01990 [Alphaproteobacteria bacterium]|nr:hypothetical protein [Alphaproteobacteria bacterium]